jgi:hypothetical protein
VAALSVALAPAADAGWARPVALSPAESFDIVPAQVAFSSGGEAAVAFGVQDPEEPAFADAFAEIAPAGGKFAAPRRLRSALSVLGLGFDGPALELLTGSSPGGRACCATVRALAAGSSVLHLGTGTVLVRGLTGITDAQLVPLAAPGKSGPMLAAIATERAVWVSRSDAAGSFPVAHRLHFTGTPADLGATSLADGGGIVAWSNAVGGYPAQPQSILIASGTRSRAPSTVRVAVTAPSGHAIDQLAIAPGPVAPTLAWIESWYDSHGGYHSAVMARELTRSARTQTISPGFELASELSLAGNLHGRLVLGYEGCSAAGACVARAAVRGARGQFGRPQWLGFADSSEQVATGISSSGEALAGWLDGGQVIASARAASAKRFGRAHVVSSANLGSDLTFGYGPGSTALAVWTEGAATPSVYGASFKG